PPGAGIKTVESGCPAELLKITVQATGTSSYNCALHNVTHPGATRHVAQPVQFAPDLQTRLGPASHPVFPARAGSGRCRQGLAPARLHSPRAGDRPAQLR